MILPGAAFGFATLRAGRLPAMYFIIVNQAP
jgi:hypothetical protein